MATYDPRDINPYYPLSPLAPFYPNGGAGGSSIVHAPSPGSWTSTTITTADKIECEELTVGKVDMRVLVEQLSTMIPIFVPPDGDEISHPSVKEAYDRYMAARGNLVVLRDQLDFLIKMVKEQNVNR